MIFKGDCLAVLREMESNSVDSLVTDPPAGISFMGKEWDSNKGGRDQWIAWLTEVMRECYRVLKPGAHGLVWAIPRTSHWTATALENAGFEVRDVVTHLFGTGFPKSLDISKAIDKAAGAERGIVATIKKTPSASSENMNEGWKRPWAENHPKTMDITTPATDAAKQWSGFGTALKPAAEFWVLVRKPLGEKTVAANVLKHGVGGLNIDGCRVGGVDTRSKTGGAPEGSGWGTKPGAIAGSELGRFPANVVLSHNEDCEATCSEGCAVAELDLGSGGASRFFMAFSRACGSEKTKGGATFAGKKAANKSENLSTDGLGSKPTGQYLMGTISITKMETRSIISFPILSASTPNPIGTCTIESENVTSLLTASNIESVSVAENLSASIHLRGEVQAPITGIAKFAQQTTCENGANKTATIGMPTIETTGARFLYAPKASKADRNAGLEGMPEKAGIQSAYAGLSDPRMNKPQRGLPSANHHPTVKSTKLMEYLIRLVTPPGGIVLDPFMGSGSTGVAARREGFGFVGIEMNQEYFEIANRRIEAATL